MEEESGQTVTELEREFLRVFVPRSVGDAHELLYDMADKHGFSPDQSSLRACLNSYAALLEAGMEAAGPAAVIELLGASELALAYAARAADDDPTLPFRAADASVKETLDEVLATFESPPYSFFEGYDALKRVAAIRDLLCPPATGA